MAAVGGDDATTQASLTVAATARRLGVAPSTLRTWDRRYQLGPSAHTAGAHRRYSATDLARLVVMRTLTMQGVSPSEAAELARAGAPIPEVEGQAWPLGTRPGGGRVVALPEASPAVRGLARAAIALDTAESTRLMSAAIDAQGVVSAWDTLALPVLDALGRRWQATGEGVDVEHAFSESLLACLVGRREGREGDGPPRVLLVCAQADQHTLPLYVLAAALAEARVACRMLGSGLPDKELLAAVRRSGPCVVFLFATMPVSGVEVLELIPRQRPAPRVLVGGLGWRGDDLPRGVTHVRQPRAGRRRGGRSRPAVTARAVVATRRRIVVSLFGSGSPVRLSTSPGSAAPQRGGRRIRSACEMRRPRW